MQRIDITSEEVENAKKSIKTVKKLDSYSDKELFVLSAQIEKELQKRGSLFRGSRRRFQKVI